MENEFDFNENRKRRVESEERFQKFVSIGRNIGIALAVAGVLGAGSYYAYEARQSSIQEQISSTQKYINTIPRKDMMNFLSVEEKRLNESFVKNQALITQHGRYKQMIEILGLENQLALLNKNNSQVFQNSYQNIKKDAQTLTTLYDHIESPKEKSSTDLKEYKRLMPVYEKWRLSYSKGASEYILPIAGITKELNESLQVLAKTQNEMVKEVQERLKNKDYNLDLAQSKVVSALMQESEAEIKDLKTARLELLDTQKALKEEGEKKNIEGMLTEDDIAQAEVAMQSLVNEALNVVSEDRMRVEKLIAEAGVLGGLPAISNNENGVQEEPQPSGSSASTTPTTVVHSGPSFLDYYLLYTFMNMGSHNSSMGAVNSLAANNSAGLSASKVNAGLNSNPYSLKNQNSYLNKNLTQKANANMTSTLRSNWGVSNAQRANLNNTRAQIQNVQSKASQVRSTRMAELTRMGYTGMSNNGGSINRGVKSASRAKSTVSRSSMGSRSGGFGG